MSESSGGKPTNCPCCGAEVKKKAAWAGTWAKSWACGSFQTSAAGDCCLSSVCLMRALARLTERVAALEAENKGRRNE